MVIRKCDAACWAAGVVNAHPVLNESALPCSYVMVGTRVTRDVCHYPDSRKTLHSEGGEWRMEGSEGNVLRSGTFDPYGLDWRLTLEPS